MVKLGLDSFVGSELSSVGAVALGKTVDLPELSLDFDELLLLGESFFTGDSF
jgi:hypothetical protein